MGDYATHVQLVCLFCKSCIDIHTNARVPRPIGPYVCPVCLWGRTEAEMLRVVDLFRAQVELPPLGR